MRKQLVLLAGMLLCPILAGAQSPYVDPREPPWWLGVGLGGGMFKSLAPAPSAGRDALSFSIDAGLRFTPEWGAGLEYGMVMPNSGCGGHSCTPADAGFAPNFSHWFLVGESRPLKGVRLRAGIGVSGMCYSFHKTRSSAFERFLEALFFDDDDYYYDDSTHWECNSSLKALGGSVSIGYQWPLADPGSSIGLQLRGEAANFAASSAAGTPAFHHRAVTLQVQLNIN